MRPPFDLALNLRYYRLMNLSPIRLITGLCIVAFGALLLLSNLNLYHFDEFFRTWWPLILIGAGALMYLNDRGNYLWAGLVAFFGLLFQVRELNLLSVSPWQLFWPSVIIFVGISILMNRSTGTKRVSKADRDDTTAILGGSDLRSASEDFKGSNATAIMGGVKLDLRKATIKTEATVSVFCFWGGVEIVAPRNVIVRNQTSAILGGVEDKTDQEAGAKAPVLYITGDVIMGGVEVKN